MRLPHMQHGTILNLPQELILILLKPGRIQARRIHNLNLPILIKHFGRQRIPRGVWHLRDNHLLIPNNLVDQTGFAHVWTADETDLYGVL